MPFQKMRALVVDDDDVIRGNVAEVLSNEGWEVNEASSTEQALELLHGEVWSQVFCDVKLRPDGDRDGYHILRSFNQEQPNAQIILMTADGSAIDALDDVSSGDSGDVMK